MRFLLFFLLFSTYAFSHEVKLPYNYFVIKDIYHLDNGKIIYIEQTPHGESIWEKNATGELNKISSFWWFGGIAKECSAYKYKEFENVVFGSHKEYYYGGGIDEYFPIRMYYLHESKPYRQNDIGMVPNMKEAKSWCTFYEPIR